MEYASQFEEQVRALQSSWRERVGTTRRDSAVRLLIGMLPAAPVLTVSTAAELIGRSFQATSQGIDRLVDAGVLAQINVGRRNRAFEAPELIEAFNSLERLARESTGRHARHMMANPEHPYTRDLARRGSGPPPMLALLVQNPCLMKSATRSPIIRTVTLMLARTHSGMIEASTTRRPSAP